MGEVVWRVGLYLRLSREDGGDESMSVTHQRLILEEFLHSDFKEPYLTVSHYIDDGASGTDYDRPAFGRLLRDVENGKVNCIICKNLSRAFRNYADQGYFLEKFFPLHRTRFITLGDPKVDSFRNPEFLQGLEVPISGLMNDRYAAKTSSDVRRTFEAKRRRGEFIGAFAPYGYRKDLENKNHLVPDPEAAPVVREVFAWFVREGMSKQGIARRLNALQIPSPAAYKRLCGLAYYNPNTASDPLWSAKTVRDMLTNPVYAGDLAQGRQRVVSYKIHSRVAVPREDWVVARETHTPLIGRPLFDAAQLLHAQAARTAPAKAVPPLFSGLVYCADCGKAMTRRASKGYTYYACRTRKADPQRCAPRSVREDRLENAVLAALQAQLSHLPGPPVPAGFIPGAPPQFPCPSQRERELDRLRAASDHLYLDWRAGDMSQEEYARRSARFASRLQKLEERLPKPFPPPGSGHPDSPAAQFLRTGVLSALDRGLLTALVRRILVRRDGSVELVFPFPPPVVPPGLHPPAQTAQPAPLEPLAQAAPPGRPDPPALPTA